MVAFGGGGPMHGPTLAKELNIRKVVVPVAASVFSAWGMLMTDIRHDFIQTRITSFSTAPMEELNAMWTELMAEARAVFAQEGVFGGAGGVHLHRGHALHGPGAHRPGPDPCRAMEGGRQGRDNGPLPQDARALYTFSLPDTPAEIVNLHSWPTAACTSPELREIAPHEEI